MRPEPSQISRPRVFFKLCLTASHTSGIQTTIFHVKTKIIGIEIQATPIYNYIEIILENNVNAISINATQLISFFYCGLI